LDYGSTGAIDESSSESILHIPDSTNGAWGGALTDSLTISESLVIHNQIAPADIVPVKGGAGRETLQ
jgi:hypothetical protein